ncbi:MAG TPA: extracellular solute-binding protein [Candidatus Binatia bacterium]|jgi:iron(III) transport system substrate-binding protein
MIAHFLRALLTAAWLAPFFSAPAFAASAEELLAEINKLPASERQKRLEEGAKKEGSLTVYSNQGIETIRAYSAGFGKKYPFVKIDSTRLQGAAGLERILLEHRIGKLQADVAGVDFDNITELLNGGVLGRYDSPEKKAYASQFWDKDGRWYVTDYTLVVIAYNGNLVKPAEAPKSYADLLNPKWKNDISIDTEPEQAVFVWLLDWGEAKTVEYMKSLMRNGAVPRRGHTLQVQLLCSGETKIAVEVYPARVAQMKHEKGCPIEMVFPDPTPGSLGSHAGVVKSAARPHAAALYLDFILSAEGAAALAKNGGLPARKGVKMPWEEISNLDQKTIRMILIGPDKMPVVKDKGYKLIEEIIVRKQIR